MSGEHQPTVARFRPLGRPAPWRLILVAVIGPLIWVAALLVGAWVLEHRDAIEVGVAVAGASFLVSLVVLSLVRAGRRREERRYADRH